MDPYNKFFDVLAQAVDIISYLPNCVLKSIDYMSNLETGLEKYFDLYHKIFHSISYKNEGSAIFTDFYSHVEGDKHFNKFAVMK